MGNGEVHIRVYQLPDAPSLIELYNVTWNATYSRSLGIATVQEMLFDLRSSNMKNMIPNDDEVTLLAEADKNIVGSAIFAERHGVAYLWGMYVLPYWQSNGVGSKLLNAVIDQLTSSKCIEVRVLQTSAGARGFYLKHGFKKIGEEETEFAKGKSASTNVLTLDIQTTK